MQDYAKDALRKALTIDTFVECFKTVTLINSSSISLISLYSKLLEHFNFVDFLLIKYHEGCSTKETGHCSFHRAV